MSALSKLKLVAAHAEKKSPLVLRRTKLTGKIADQIAAAKAATSGETYASKVIVRPAPSLRLVSLPGSI